MPMPMAPRGAIPPMGATYMPSRDHYAPSAYEYATIYNNKHRRPAGARPRTAGHAPRGRPARPVPVYYPTRRPPPIDPNAKSVFDWDDDEKTSCCAVM